MMRKSIGLIALVMVAMAFVVAPAAAEFVTTGVEIGLCDNDAPIIKCKWEQDTSGCLEDGDVTHSEFEPTERNSWFKPTCNESTFVDIYTVVNDDDGITDIDSVLYSVTGPCGKTWSGCMGPCGDITTVQDADTAKLIYYSPGYDLTEIEWEFAACEEDVAVFCDQIEISYCDPAGEYQVEVWAKDNAGIDSNHLINNFTMTRLGCCDFDFDTLTWDKMVKGDKEIISGDEDMTSADRPSVINLGNVPIKIKVKGAALEMGGTPYVFNDCDEYLYKYDAKLRDQGNYVNFFPEATNYKTIQGFVERCDVEALCFSLQILNAMEQGVYTGTMELVCEDTLDDPCITYPI